MEDFHLLIELATTTDNVIFTNQDFITVGIYSFYDSGGGSQRYRLAVLDRNKYFFQNQAPSHSLPALGGALALVFNKQKSQLETEWQKAADSDTLDNLITYEISYDGGTNWQSTGGSNKTQKIVAPVQSFSILVRAKDDFGNYSNPPLAASWSYPETVFYITQAQLNNWSFNFGTKNPNCPGCPGTAILQSIQPARDFQFNTVTLKLRQEQASDAADLLLSLYADGGGLPNFNSLIAEAQLKDMMRLDPNSDVTFTFDAPASVFANINYWLVLSVKKYSDSAGFFRNSWQNAINTGSDFYGSGQAGKGNSGTCDGYCNFTVPYPDAAADWYMKLGFAQ